jgi:hypothetical protein
MEVVRVISIYEKAGEKLVEEVEILDLSLDALKGIVKPDEDDPKLYKAYGLTEVQYNIFKSQMSKLDNFKYTEYDFYYECFDVSRD